MTDKKDKKDKTKKIENPHDKFFKETFSNPLVTRDFLENYLPQPILKIIDLNNLEIQNSSHVDEELSEVFSDMLFKTKINQRDGYLYFLFEHKSYPDRLVALQLLTYMVRIWNQKVNRETHTHIPVIIPLVIYHGKTEWKMGSMLSELILDFDSLPEEVKQMIPDYRYLLYDLSRFSDDEIKGDAKLTIALSIFRDIFMKNGQDFMETIFKAARALDELEEKETGIHYFETCMRYILASGPQLSKDQLNTVIKQLEVTYKKGSEITMTLAEVLREEGFEKGIEKGKKESLSELAINRLSRKFGIMPTEYQGKIAKLDLNMMEVLNYEIDNFTSIEDVKKFLAL